MNSAGGSFNSKRDGILHTRKDERRSTLRRFQFPTGWNSTGQQRAGVGDNTLFQFPTGWNSTQIYPKFYRYIEVSIPNGMEFYALEKPQNEKLKSVSIPNGMELYYIWYRLDRCDVCFNSQQDRIPLKILNEKL